MKKALSSISLIGYSVLSFVLPAMAAPTPLTEASGSISSIVDSVVTYVISIAAAIAVGMLVYGGVVYMTGGEAGAKSGKGIIMNALIGMAIIALSYVIVNAVVAALK